ncbi:uncharacterized protein [Porites lutea]|uniref:uncharacterized protein n=1 Tax=Porites lutea TaxID=51062 RepID=UPI003CC5FCBA
MEMAPTSVNSSRSKGPSNLQFKQDNRPAIEEKYSPDEIDAAYALLALSSSAPASPPCYKTVTVKPGADASSTATDDKQLPCVSQTPYQSTPQIHSCQVSPLAELNSFVAVALPYEDEKCPLKNEMHSTSLPGDFTVWRCGNHGVWACQQCFHAVNP